MRPEITAVIGEAAPRHMPRYAQVPNLQVVYLRGIRGGILVEDQHEVTAYKSAFQQLSVSALTPDASATLAQPDRTLQGRRFRSASAPSGARELLRSEYP